MSDRRFRQRKNRRPDRAAKRLRLFVQFIIGLAICDLLMYRFLSIGAMIFFHILAGIFFIGYFLFRDDDYY